MISEVVAEYKAIKEEYRHDPSIFNPDDPRVARLKEVIDTRLSQADKTILLLYVDCQSYRKLGKKLNLSHMTCRREVMRIKQIVLNELQMNKIYIHKNDLSFSERKTDPTDVEYIRKDALVEWLTEMRQYAADESRRLVYMNVLDKIESL